MLTFSATRSGLGVALFVLLLAQTTAAQNLGLRTDCGVPLEIAGAKGQPSNFISPLWDERRDQIAALTPLTPDWIEHHARNSLVTNRKTARALGVKETTFQAYYVSGNAVPQGLESKMKSLLTKPGNLIRSNHFRSFSEWLRWHVVNNPWKWTARDIEGRAGLVPNSLSKLMKIEDSSRTPSEGTLYLLCGTLQASCFEALASARFNPKPVDFGSWLRERLVFLGISAPQAAKRSGISVPQIYHFLNGDVRFPTRKSALLLARGLELRAETVLLAAGYLPERSYFGDWVSEMLVWADLSFESLVKASEVDGDELRQIIGGDRWPSRGQVLRIGNALGDVDMALAQAAMNQRLPGFLEFWKNHATYPPDEEEAMAKAIGIPSSELQNLASHRITEQTVPGRDIVLRFAEYRGLEPESTLQICGHKKLKLPDRIFEPRPKTLGDEHSHDRVRATGT